MRIAKWWMAAIVAAAVAALAALPAAAEAPEAGGCVGKARLRGPLWDTTNAALEPGLDAALDVIAETIREQCRGKGIVIEGHAFEMPSAELNMKLSELRVLLVRDELRKRGVPPHQLYPVPLGDTRPIAPKDDPDAVLENRRITFRAFD